MTMTFKEKLSSSIQTLAYCTKLDYPIIQHYYYVDFIELLALMAGEDGISVGDIHDRFYGEPDESVSAEDKDCQESFIDGLFLRIAERIEQYGDCYPFMIKDEFTLAIKTNLSNCQKMYLFLLMASSLDFFKLFNTELTADFESISRDAMASFLPNAQIRAFGKNHEYEGTAVEKIKKLAKDIGLQIKESEVNCISPKNVQERGLDIVGWMPFSDECPNKLIFLCQCACGKNFESKQGDTRMFRSYYEFYKINPIHIMFVPYSLINPQDKRFFNSDRIYDDGGLIFERLRILDLTKGLNEIFNNLRSKDLVEECIKFHN